MNPPVTGRGPAIGRSGPPEARQAPAGEAGPKASASGDSAARPATGGGGAGRLHRRDDLGRRRRAGHGEAFRQCVGSPGLQGDARRARQLGTVPYTVEDLASAYLKAQEASTATAIDPGDAEGPKNVDGTEVVDVEVGVGPRSSGGRRDPEPAGRGRQGRLGAAPDLPRPADGRARRAPAHPSGAAPRSWPRTGPRSPQGEGPPKLPARLGRDRHRRRDWGARTANGRRSSRRQGYPRPEHRRQRPRARLQLPAGRHGPAASCWR